MKFALLNYSGNVGKTTIARDLLRQNLQDYELISVESVNADGKEETIIKGEEGDKLFTEILVNDNLILDIGSSNLEFYFKNSSRESELIDSIDVFIVPVTPERKQQADTLKTMRDLINQSVEPSKIVVIFNQVPDNGETVDEMFLDFISMSKKLNIHLDTSNVILRHNLYDRGQTLGEMLSNEDYRAKMEESKASGDIEKSREYARQFVKQKKIKLLNDCYINIFDKLYEVANA